MKRKAFGLIETLLACMVLILIIGAIVVLNVIVTRNIRFSKQRASAYYLAQEGIETARQIRDSNAIDGDEKTNWDTLIIDGNNLKSATVFDNQNYVVSQKQIAGQDFIRPFLVPSVDGEKITLEAGDFSSGIEFSRKIKFTKSGINSPDIQKDGESVVDQNSLRIICSVDWMNNNQPQTIEISEVLTNWKQGL